MSRSFLQPSCPSTTATTAVLAGHADSSPPAKVDSRRRSARDLCCGQKANGCRGGTRRLRLNTPWPRGPTQRRAVTPAWRDAGALVASFGPKHGVRRICQSDKNWLCEPTNQLEGSSPLPNDGARCCRLPSSVRYCEKVGLG